MNNLTLFLSITGALGSGLMAGLFFTFSNFVMKALVDLPPKHGCGAMQAINIKIINPWFFGLFFGTALISLVSVIVATLHGDTPGTRWMLGGAVLYLAGCILVTLCGNVPLNDKLAVLDPGHLDSAIAWQHYVAHWMPWNHVRTVATLAATASFAMALVARP